MNQTNYSRFLKQIIFIITILSITITNMYAWGSLWTFDRVFATHQLLNEKAYEKLEKHPALLYADFPILSDIQEHGSVKVGASGKYGLGPDVDGNSLFSQHWYNPNNQQGKAPETIAKLHDYLRRLLLKEKGKNKISKAHSAAYAAHYMQDMTCPMHVTGMLAVNNGKLINLYDKNKAKNISPYAGYYTDEEWKALIGRYKRAYEADKTKTLDFFDPLYFDANYKNPLLLKFDTASSELGSHYQYEAQVGLKYYNDNNSMNRWNAFKKADKYIPKNYNNKISIDELAKNAAIITRKAMRKGGEKGEELWIDIGKYKPAYELPGLSSINILPAKSNRDVIYNSLTVPYKTWWRAIQLTYVTWRSSFSALHIADFDVRFIKLDNKKNMYQPNIHVRNLEPESIAKGVNVSLKISGDINMNASVDISGSIPKYKESDSKYNTDQGISDWTDIGRAIEIEDIHNLNGKMEFIITGKYDEHIPDSGKKRVQYDLKNLHIEEKKRKRADKNTNLKPHMPSYGTQCPKQNPGNKESYKFDTNNNPKDRTYLFCSYYKGKLSSQEPYKNGKLDGVVFHIRLHPGYSETTSIFKNGKLHGLSETWWKATNNYNPYSQKINKTSDIKKPESEFLFKYSESKYINGETIETIKYNKKGEMMNKTTYHGECNLYKCAHTTREYRKGKLINCFYNNGSLSKSCNK